MRIFGKRYYKRYLLEHLVCKHIKFRITLDQSLELQYYRIKRFRVRHVLFQSRGFSFGGLTLPRQLIEKSFNVKSSKIHVQKLFHLAGQVYHSSTSIDDLMVSAAFAIAFGGFLRMDEFMYFNTSSDKHILQTRLTRNDACFAKDFSYLTLRPKTTKTSTTAVTVTIAATGDRNCPVALLRKLYLADP